MYEVRGVRWLSIYTWILFLSIENDVIATSKCCAKLLSLIFILKFDLCLF